MTPGEVLDRAAALGVALSLGAGGRIEYRGERAAVEAILPDLRANASAIAAALREHQPVPCASDAVAAAASLLRVGHWAHVAGPCSFHIGPAGADCIRCGSPWLEHFTVSGLAR